MKVVANVDDITGVCYRNSRLCNLIVMEAPLNSYKSVTYVKESQLLIPGCRKDLGYRTKE
jgi:hypothetical protein